MGDFWHGCDYDPFRRNCNNFTETIISFVCNKREYYVPSYINRFCKMGTAFIMWFKPLQQIVGDLVNYEEELEEQR